MPDKDNVGLGEYISGAITSAITTTNSTEVIAAQTGYQTLVTDILVTNSHATVGTRVDILDGTTVKYTGYAKEAGGGFAVQLKTPLVGTVATAWNAKCATSGANVYVSLSGYRIR